MGGFLRDTGLGPVVMAFAVIIGAFVGFGLLSRQDMRPAPTNIPTSVASGPRRPARPPQPLIPQDRARPEPPAAHAPALAAPSATQRSRLARLQQLCNYWSRRNTRGQYMGYQYQACDDMQRYAATLGESSTPVTITTSPAAGAAPRNRSTSHAPNVFIKPCDAIYGYGTIAGRRCRAEEKSRLGEHCQHYLAASRTARGRDHEMKLALHRAYCLAYDHYRVVE